MEIWIVMERWVHDYDGDEAVEFEAAHASEAGAAANLVPDYATTGFAPGTRERWMFGAELLP
jgi:hypothetical protein